jgi:hypothetical protein
MKVSQKKKRIFDAIKAKYEDADLDDQVHEIMTLKASEINNEGVDAQLEFLANACGLKWLEDYYLKER